MGPGSSPGHRVVPGARPCHRHSRVPRPPSRGPIHLSTWLDARACGGAGPGSTPEPASGQVAEANVITHRPRAFDTDILILGAGGAGLFAALHAKKAAPELDVTIAVKGLL